MASSETIEVRLAALKACSAFVTASQEESQVLTKFKSQQQAMVAVVIDALK